MVGVGIKEDVHALGGAGTREHIEMKRGRRPWGYVVVLAAMAVAASCIRYVHMTVAVYGQTTVASEIY
jgi:hypothetical protein